MYLSACIGIISTLASKMFKPGDLVKHRLTGWLGIIVLITEADIHVRVIYEPRGAIFENILLFPSQLGNLERVA